MTFLVAAAAVLLSPVNGGSAELQADDTFVSEIARSAISEDPTTVLHCMAAPENNVGTERICLTSGEWQAVSDKAEADASIDRRELALRLTEWQGNRLAN